MPVTYAKRVRGLKTYGGTNTYMPLRLNQAGVIPIIFALSLLLLPQMLASFFVASGRVWMVSVGHHILNVLQNLWIYGAVYFALVFIFTFFYTAITFEPKTVAENLQRNGAFIPGVRPGNATI